MAGIRAFGSTLRDGDDDESFNLLIGDVQRLAQRAASLQALIDQLGLQSDPTQLSTAYAGDFERLNDRQNYQDAQLQGTMAARGLTDSSFNAAALGAKASSDATATSGLQNQISQEARTRGDMLREMLYRLYTGETSGAAGLINDISSDRFRQQELDSQPGWWESIIPSAIGAAGTYFGGRASRPRSS